jgi:hypothetical protein
MSSFEDFTSTYGPPENCEKPSAEAMRKYEGKLPPELLDHWREVGWCSWGNGLLWVVNPDQFKDVMADWLDFDPESAPVFLRTAFGHLYLWHEGYVYSLDVQHGSGSKVTPKVERMFTLLCDPELQEKILRRGLFEQARQLLGPPGRDECYAFEPALALGGSGAVETIRRVKMREHLAILAQIVR